MIRRTHNLIKKLQVTPENSSQYEHLVDELSKYYDYLVTGTISKYFIPEWIDREALTQECRLDLLNAIKKFDPDREPKAQFPTFAIRVLRNGIEKHLGKLSEVRAAYKDERKINRAIFILEQRNNRQPTKTELAEFLGISTEKLDKLLTNAMQNRPLYLDQCISSMEGEPITLGDTIADPMDNGDYAVRTAQIQMLTEGIETLPLLLRAVLVLHLNNFNFHQIASILKLRTSTVSHYLYDARKMLLDLIVASGGTDLFAGLVKLEEENIP